MAIFIVFGRPGSGKSTITKRTKKIIENDSNNNDTNLLCLDLDVCIPKWMKDNFAKGTYPTLNQRKDFAIDACNYVNTQISKFNNLKEEKETTILISFSFVNNDLRVIFRERFPNYTWVLIDTNEDISLERIKMRNDHFYNGNINKDKDSTNIEEMNDDITTISTGSDNDEWKFESIDFDHVILDGLNDIADNANSLIQIIQEKN